MSDDPRLARPQRALPALPALPAWIVRGWPLAAVFVVALALRLAVWQWREFYPLGGDEQEYLQQALILLREHRYSELRLMRPPLYGAFLAGSILLVDSLVQNLRLVQACISAATVVPLWLLTAELLRWYRPPAATGTTSRALPSPPTLAALLCALSYTLAAYASELLTETLFLFGLTILFWLLVRAAARGSSRPASAAAAGVVLGLLCLTRSVAVVLLPLGALWLLSTRKRVLTHTAPFVLAAVLVVLPWTVRNALTYHAFILIDTTGAENLWLDNDPAGREAVKAQLYALEDDRPARQRIAAASGLAAIVGDPLRFVHKAWGELLKLFALEHSDDMLARPVIWVPPGEVWARLLLGDMLWLLVLLAGAVGLSIATPAAPHDQPHRQAAGLWAALIGHIGADPRWLLGGWALYTVLTALVFHVELRYRLPLYPVLLPYAALALVQGAGCLWRRAACSRWRWAAGGLLAVLLLLLMLLHRPYPLLAWHLGWKHYHLTQAERYLEMRQSQQALAAARAALTHDPESVLARVAWARAALMANDWQSAADTLDQAMEMLPDHPLPHLLLGDMLRSQNQLDNARRELAYETASLQDLQGWGWQWFATAPPSRLDIGGGLDLGWLQGFYAAEGQDATLTWRWTKDRALLRLSLPTSANPAAAALCASGPPELPGTDQYALLYLRLAAGRPSSIAAPIAEVLIGGQQVAAFQVAPGWQDYTLPLPASVAPPAASDAASVLTIELRNDTFTPRAADPTSADGRTLGMMVDQAGIVICSTY